jgi:hypothetical protein
LPLAFVIYRTNGAMGCDDQGRSAEEYRAKARECEELAEQTRDSFIKEHHRRRATRSGAFSWSLRPILRRMRQRPFVLKDLAQITAINPAAAGRHLIKCSASSFGRAPTSLPIYLPRGASIIVQTA